MGKVEEVARALYAATPFKTAGSYDSQSEVYKRMCRVLARVAIEAMKVPTEAMLTAGKTHMVWPHVPTIYNTMIDAALSEDKEQG